MAQLLIRDLEVETIERLKARAKLHRRSLQGEVKLILENEAGMSRDSPRALAERIRAAFGGRIFSDSADIIREDRGR